MDSSRKILLLMVVLYMYGIYKYNKLRDSNDLCYLSIDEHVRTIKDFKTSCRDSIEERDQDIANKAEELTQVKQERSACQREAERNVKEANEARDLLEEKLQSNEESVRQLDEAKKNLQALNSAKENVDAQLRTAQEEANQLRADKEGMQSQVNSLNSQIQLLKEREDARAKADAAQAAAAAAAANVQAAEAANPPAAAAQGAPA